jgi:hypothetical protein
MESETILEIILDRFEYIEEQQGLVYKKWFNGLNPDRVGTRIGAPNPRGYRIVKILGKMYREHQLVWLMFNNELVIGSKDKLIDHIDSNPSNCRLDNLRVVSQRENCRNRLNQETPNIFKTPSNSYSVYIDFNRKRTILATVESIEHGQYILSKLKTMGETEENAKILKNMYKGGKLKNRDLLNEEIKNAM